MRRYVPLVLVSVLTFSSPSVHGQARDLTNLDLDALMGMDVLAWEPTTGIELSVSVDNISNDEHVEFFDDVALRPGATLGRSYFARFTVRPKL